MQRITVTTDKGIQEYDVVVYSVFAGILSLTLTSGRKMSIALNKAQEVKIVRVKEDDHGTEG